MVVADRKIDRAVTDLPEEGESDESIRSHLGQNLAVHLSMWDNGIPNENRLQVLRPFLDFIKNIFSRLGFVMHSTKRTV